MPVQTVIKTRRDTAANWLSTNPVLGAGEAGLETDTGLVKYGNGTLTWSALAYASSSRTTQIAKNNTGGSVTRGQVVYISGANGANALFLLADADSEATSSKTVGLLAQDLATNGIGAIVTEGLLSNVNTGAASAGDSVWLSGTAGGFVFGAPPAKPAHSVYLGVVTRASITVGEILVKVQNGYELNELHDVNAGSPADNNVLAWDSASSMWTNQTAAQAGLAPAANAALTGTTTAQNLTLTGDLIVGGTTTSVNATNLEVTDPLIYIGTGNTADVADIGLVGHFDNGTYQHSGLARDASDGKWKLFKGVTDEPTTVVNFAQATMDTLVVGPLEAASATIGDVSNTELQYLNGVTSAVQTQLDGKAATSHTHAQSAITNLTTDLAAKAPLASPSFTGAATFTGTIDAGTTINEKFNSTGTVVAAGATYNLDTSLGSVWSNMTVGNQVNNFNLNIRSSSGATYLSTIPNGSSSTVTFMFSTGTTAVGPITFSIDGVLMTPYFLNGLKTYGVNCVNVITLTTVKSGGSASALYVSITKFAQ